MAEDNDDDHMILAILPNSVNDEEQTCTQPCNTVINEPANFLGLAEFFWLISCTVFNTVQYGSMSAIYLKHSQTFFD